MVAAGAGCSVTLNPAQDLERAGAELERRASYMPGWDREWTRDMRWRPGEPLPLDRAVLTALTNNAALREQLEMVGAARADLAQAGLLPNPVIAVNLRVPLEGGSPVSFASGSISQNFVALWLRPSRVRSADARLNQAVYNLTEHGLRVVADVKSAHARVVFAQRGVEVAEQNLALVDRCEDALRRAAHPLRGTADRLAHRRGSLRLGRDLLVTELASGRRELLGIIGLPGLAGEYWATDPGSDAGPGAYPPVLTEGLSEEGAVLTALQERLDVLAARAVIEAHKGDMDVQERSRIRDLGIGVMSERTGEQLRLLGVQNTVPIFDFNQAQIAKAGSLGRAAFAQAEAVTQRAISEVRMAHVHAVMETASAARFRDEVLPPARVALDNAIDALGGEDSADLAALLDSLDRLCEANTRSHSLERDAVLARVHLEHAMGGRLLLAPADPQQPAQR
jgi:cobalt-zinc-cadmium efflux system outer membrane protein